MCCTMRIGGRRPAASRQQRLDRLRAAGRRADDDEPVAACARPARRTERRLLPVREAARTRPPRACARMRCFSCIGHRPTEYGPPRLGDHVDGAGAQRLDARRRSAAGSRELTMITGSGQCAISLRRNVRPSMRGISMSSVHHVRACAAGSDRGRRTDPTPVRRLPCRARPAARGEQLADDRGVVDDEHRGSYALESAAAGTGCQLHRDGDRRVIDDDRERRPSPAAAAPRATDDARVTERERASARRFGSARRRRPCWRTRRPDRASPPAPAPDPTDRVR